MMASGMPDVLVVWVMMSLMKGDRPSGRKDVNRTFLRSHRLSSRLRVEEKLAGFLGV